MKAGSMMDRHEDEDLSWLEAGMKCVTFVCWDGTMRFRSLAPLIKINVLSFV